MKKRYLEAGKIVNTHGTQGEVKLIPWCDAPEFLLDFDTLYLDGQPLKIRSAKVHKGNLLIHFEGVEDINAAMRLKDKIVSLDREDASLPPDRHFIADLIGLEVREISDGHVLGTLEEVLTPPAHPVYVVRGEREYLIPGVDAFVAETNLEDGYMMVRLIEGMGD